MPMATLQAMFSFSLPDNNPSDSQQDKAQAFNLQHETSCMTSSLDDVNEIDVIDVMNIHSC